jgi:hypothetical protein
MNDDNDENNRGKGDPKPGRGLRSLQTWWNLAHARDAMRNDEAARKLLESDPDAFCAQFGVTGILPSELNDLGHDLGEVSAPELELDARRLHATSGGAVLPVVSVAVNANIAINANVNLNANANANYNWNVSQGGPHPQPQPAPAPAHAPTLVPPILPPPKKPPTSHNH